MVTKQGEKLTTLLRCQKPLQLCVKWHACQMDMCRCGAQGWTIALGCVSDIFLYCQTHIKVSPLIQIKDLKKISIIHTFSLVAIKAFSSMFLFSISYHKVHDKKKSLLKRDEKATLLNTLWSPADEAASLLMYEMWTLRDKVTYIWLT